MKGFFDKIAGMTEDFTFPEDLTGIHFHFVGIKGTGMAALVEVLHRRGAFITGSDVSERFYTDEILEKLNIKALPFSKDNISGDIKYVIYSSAYSKDKNPDLAEAVRKNIPVFVYSEALGAVSRSSYSCGICGVHGKTTTTGLTGTVLKAAGLSAQVLAGSVIKSFGDSCVYTSDAGHKYFVAETCEYQRHFMSFEPQKIVLTSVESDHQDYYPTYKDIQNAFVDYILKLPRNGELIYCADDRGALETAGIAFQKRPDIKMIPYGVNAEGDYSLEFGSVENGIHSFKTGFIGDCAIRVPGAHNVRNAVAAIALTCELLRSEGKNPLDYAEKIKEGLLDFAGGKRRSEITGEAKTPLNQSVIFIDDYGHHPTAIKTTLSGYRDFYKGHKIIVDFMSHTYTRTAALLEEFASSFSSADRVIINKIYGSARENAGAAEVSGRMLAEHAKKYHKDVTYAEEFDEAAAVALKMLSEPSGEEYPDGYVFVTMGAGDNWKVGEKVLSSLRKES